MKYIGLFDEKEDIVTKDKLDAVESAIPTKTSQLDNDSGFITSAPVTSVNAKTGAVTLSAADVSAIPSTLTGTAGQVLTKTADGQEWKDAASPQPSTTTPLAPTETGSVGTSTAYARGDHVHPKQEIPVKSVNGKTGAVSLIASDVGAATMTQVNSAIQTAIGNAIGGSY